MSEIQKTSSQLFNELSKDKQDFLIERLNKKISEAVMVGFWQLGGEKHQEAINRCINITRNSIKKGLERLVDYKVEDESLCNGYITTRIEDLIWQLDKDNELRDYLNANKSENLESSHFAKLVFASMEECIQEELDDLGKTES